MRFLYVQDHWDERGDLIYSCWAPRRKDSFLTYNHQDPHSYAKRYGLDIKWVLN